MLPLFLRVYLCESFENLRLLNKLDIADLVQIDNIGDAEHGREGKTEHQMDLLTIVRMGKPVHQSFDLAGEARLIIVEHTTILPLFETSHYRSL